MKPLYRTPVERLRAMVRAVNSADFWNNIPEEIRQKIHDYYQHVFYCKRLGKVVAPDECVTHWNKIKFEVDPKTGKALFTRQQCIKENAVYEGYEQPRMIKAIVKVHPPNFYEINRYILESLMAEAEVQNETQRRDS